MYEQKTIRKLFLQFFFFINPGWQPRQGLAKSQAICNTRQPGGEKRVKGYDVKFSFSSCINLSRGKKSLCT